MCGYIAARDTSLHLGIETDLEGAYGALEQISDGNIPEDAEIKQGTLRIVWRKYDDQAFRELL
jgi:hypothetical protein